MEGEAEGDLVQEKRPIEGQWVAGAWEMPYQSEADGVQQAAEESIKMETASECVPSAG